MRSDLVFEAVSHVSNRYQLCQLASKVTRKMHKPHTRVQDTANQVLGNLSGFETPMLRSESAAQASKARFSQRRGTA